MLKKDIQSLLFFPTKIETSYEKYAEVELDFKECLGSKIFYTDDRHSIYMDINSENRKIIIEGECYQNLEIRYENTKLILNLYRPYFDGSLIDYENHELHRPKRKMRQCSYQSYIL